MMSAEERTGAVRPSGIPIRNLSFSVQTALLKELDYNRFLRQYHPDVDPTITEQTVLRGSIRLSPTEIPKAELDFLPDTLRVLSESEAELWRVSRTY